MEQTAQNYLKTRVMSASPQELRLLLLDGSIKFTRQAAEGLRTKNFELSFNGFGQAREIVLELANGIREDADPDLAEKVRSVFLFIYRELMEASFEKSVERTERVIELLEYERDTWVLAMEHIADERGGKQQPGRNAGRSAPPAHPMTGSESQRSVAADSRTGGSENGRPPGSLSIQA